jgi:hypothetical protein
LQQSLTESSFPIKNLFNGRKNYINSNIVKNYPNNYLYTEDNDYKKYKNVDENEEEFQLNELDQNIFKDNFKRFRKKVLHIKKKSYLNSEGNFLYSQSFIDKSRNDNKLNSDSFNPQNNLSKTNKSIQNVFYNTYFNCLFDKEINKKNKINNVNVNINEIYSNNFYSRIKNERKNSNINLTFSKDFFNKKNSNNISYNRLERYDTEVNENNKKKDILSQKILYRNIPNLRKIGHSYSSRLYTDKSKGSDLINYCTEEKIGKIYTNQIKIYNDNKSDRNKIQTFSLNSKNRNTPISNRKRIQITSFS